MHIVCSSASLWVCRCACFAIHAIMFLNDVKSNKFNEESQQQQQKRWIENRKQKQTDKTTFESPKFSELIDFKLKLKTKIEPK